MHIQFLMRISEAGKAPRHIEVTAQALTDAPEEFVPVHYDVVELHDEGKIMAQGVLVGPRRGHPNFGGRVAALVLERAFPLVPEHRFLVLPEVEIHKPNRNP